MTLIPKKHDTAAVFGLGRSGCAVLHWLVKAGASAVAYDKNPSAAACLAEEGLSHIPFFSGEDYRRMPKADFLFRSPALRPDHPALLYHAQRGGLITDEISLFCALCPAPILAVTGSDGKSTTATLVARAIELAGHRAFLGGNIGRSLLPYLSEMKREDFAVLELSSFQLIKSDFSLQGGVITNLTPNHLNWHTDMAEYAAAKASLFDKCAYMTAKSGLFPEREALRFSLDEKTPLHREGDTLYDEGTPLFREGDMRLCGRFHLENFLAAAGVTRGIVPRSVFLPLARSFSGLPHRLEYLGRRMGRDFYNSSIDTSPLRTVASLTALQEAGVSAIVLLGGAEKGLSLSLLADALPKLAAAAVLFGESRERLKSALGGRLPLALADNLEQAVAQACRLADGTKHAVVLSPAFTAFDAFRDYAERGEVFRRIVRALPE